MEGMQARIQAAKSSSNMGTAEFRELFVCNCVLVEEALLLEDTIKASFWFNAVGAGTTAMLLTTVWTCVLVVGWTFVPGMIAFSSASSAAPNYCGAWASVLTARIECCLAVLFLIVNLITVVIGLPLCSCVHRTLPSMC